MERGQGREGEKKEGERRGEDELWGRCMRRDGEREGILRGRGVERGRERRWRTGREGEKNNWQCVGTEAEWEAGKGKAFNFGEKVRKKEKWEENGVTFKDSLDPPNTHK